MGSASDSKPGAVVLVGVVLVLHSRIVIFSYMNFLDEVLQNVKRFCYTVIKKRNLIQSAKSLKEGYYNITIPVWSLRANAFSSEGCPCRVNV